MPLYPKLALKPGKDIPVRAGHPWIFSEAIETPFKTPLNLGLGDLVEVTDHRGKSLGIGTWNANTSIRIRLLSTDATKTIDATFFADRLQALDSWKRSRLPAQTNGYRIAHAEADGLPGLIVDRYDNVIVFQLHTAGMDRLRSEIIAGITQAFHPIAIVERSDLDVRRIEGLTDGPVLDHVFPKGTNKEGQPLWTGHAQFQEYGLTFTADVLHGQKTGFFLDQREARHTVHALAKDKRVLNLFGYTGAFSVHAATGGASFVTTVDISRRALETAEEQFTLNNLDPGDDSKYVFLEADVFDLLNDAELPGAPHDLIICDPPALAKNAKHVPQAMKAYAELNAACFRHLSPGGILVTSSCSGRVTPEDFRTMLRIAAGQARRDVRILDWITQPIDHAERIAFPEGRYLKTAILEVTDILS
ncbi:class I SAM-dependent rRNA methyltransferase [Patescibacteria group bacterium]|nr:class I SAM-dependent rRNA methyltransferase [Patescibacteria group bacterium]MBP9710270.1 class I SAM-dependent rRNA methyltransferase [Patescibacteria group bacterium]